MNTEMVDTVERKTPSRELLVGTGGWVGVIMSSIITKGVTHALPEDHQRKLPNVQIRMLQLKESYQMGHQTKFRHMT